MIRILVVDDEKPIANYIKLTLKQAGYWVDCAFDGMTALEKAEQVNYDLILLDVMLPEIDGFSLMEYLAPKEVPVIFLTAKGGVQDRVKGLRLGAEDYIVKPFDVMELQARVEVVLRRYKKTEEVLHVQDIEVDTRSMQVTKAGVEISLTRKEYELLLLFIRNPNTALYRETIYERVWGGELEYGSKTVDLHVQRLRKKLGLGEELQAVNKVGYRFEVKE
ncbi:putative uncharacterized protein [Clostridium sp. CAG:632]|jgi:DNA-binding response OmpR family regulator|nr:response regulator transcription factor [Clostridium sp.]MDD6267355.1 response regulator transcription factor [Clostridium sp.]CCY58177.1 putative uncharacterized protein [Clostridium sp. CAG:632]